MSNQEEQGSIEQLKAELAYSNEQLFYTQEALRRLMMELSGHLGTHGGAAVTALMTEWTQIIQNINKDHGRTGQHSDNSEVAIKFYMSHHVSEVKDMSIEEQTLWKLGQDQYNSNKQQGDTDA